MTKGGRRQGSGRKAMSPQGRRRVISISISPETDERIAELRKEGHRIGKIFDKAIEYCYYNPHLCSFWDD